MESSFECEVCMVVYNSNEHRPRFLPCGHTLCSSCINDTLRMCNGKLTCPFCRTGCGTGVKTLDDFPTAFALLNLNDKKEPKMSSDALSQIDKENIVYLEKKQIEYDHSVSCISDCKEQISNILCAKEIQESFIESMETELKKLEEDKKKACAIRDHLDAIATEGSDIVKELEVFQDRVKCTTNLSGINEAAQDGNLYYTASKSWITFRAKSFIKKHSHLIPERLIPQEAASDHSPSLPQEATTLTSTPTTTCANTTTEPQGTTTTAKNRRRQRIAERKRRIQDRPRYSEQQEATLSNTTTEPQGTTTTASNGRRQLITQRHSRNPDRPCYSEQQQCQQQ